MTHYADMNAQELSNHIEQHHLKSMITFAPFLKFAMTKRSAQEDSYKYGNFIDCSSGAWEDLIRHKSNNNSIVVKFNNRLFYMKPDEAKRLGLKEVDIYRKIIDNTVFWSDEDNK